MKRIGKKTVTNLSDEELEGVEDLCHKEFEAIHTLQDKLNERRKKAQRYWDVVWQEQNRRYNERVAVLRKSPRYGELKTLLEELALQKELFLFENQDYAHIEGLIEKTAREIKKMEEDVRIWTP